MIYGKGMKNMFENAHDLYKSKEWKNLLQTLKLERVNESGKLLCEYCGEEIVKAYDCIGHHKIPLNNSNVNDYNISLNPDNIMLIHFKCHNAVHHRFGYELPKKVYIVYGSPCAGKSTWVESMGTADDLIIDIDKIWECISFCDKYNKPRKLQQNTFETRNCLIDQVKMRLGNWQNAFIVGTYPLKMERQRLADEAMEEATKKAEEADKTLQESQEKARMMEEQKAELLSEAKKGIRYGIRVQIGTTGRIQVLSRCKGTG